MSRIRVKGKEGEQEEKRVNLSCSAVSGSSADQPVPPAHRNGDMEVGLAG